MSDNVESSLPKFLNAFSKRAVDYFMDTKGQQQVNTCRDHALITVCKSVDIANDIDELIDGCHNDLEQLKRVMTPWLEQNESVKNAANDTDGMENGTKNDGKKSKVTNVNAKIFTKQKAKEIRAKKKVNSVGVVAVDTELPPSSSGSSEEGISINPSVKSGDAVYGAKSSLLEPWCNGKVISVVGDDYLNVEFDHGVNKLLTRKSVALFDPNPVRFILGSRVISKYDAHEKRSDCSYYPGVVAELPELLNKFRYMIFHDNGHVQYQYHKNIRLILHQTKEVWNDVHPSIKDFIQSYFKNYPERQMVSLSKNQRIRVKHNNKFHLAKVLDVDCSVVKISFYGIELSESLYRGSLRLWDNYEKRNKCVKSDGLKQSGLANSYKSLVQNSKVEENLSCTVFKGSLVRKSTNKCSIDNSNESVKRNKSSCASSRLDMSSLPNPSHLNKPFVQFSKVEKERPCAIFKGGVARKSTNRCSTLSNDLTVKQNKSSSASSRIDMLNLPNSAHLNKSFVQSSEVEKEPPCAMIGVGIASKLTNNSSKYSSDEIIKCNRNSITSSQINMSSLLLVNRPRRFVAHKCDRSCIEWTNYSYSYTKKINYLAAPLFFGFTRSVECIDSLKYVVYHTPCGCRILDIKHMLDYLIITQSDMTIDQFDFNYWVRPLAEFKETKKCLKYLEDLSCGKEFRPISCVNYISYRSPPPMEYMIARKPKSGVNINVDINFLCGCDCTDYCQDKLKCACWKLTIEAQNNIPSLYKDPIIGYNFRRLSERVITGIYECNSTCKCNNKCLNRVVQNPLSQKLQLFMTEKKGWGVRCLNDIPQGSFICIYVGYLLTENDANKEGKKYGDEYLADLDYIETVEAIKEGYESDVFIGNQEDKSSSSSSCGSINGVSDMAINLRKRNTLATGINKNGKIVHTESNSNIHTISKKSKSKPISLRKYFGKNESVYIMDAKTCGNIGRYINHSCYPNMFVQNVFVDTHDLRFPWVSFFALHYIKAGTELTWDYSYRIGSVPGRTLECYCGSVICRKRLL